MNPKNKRQNIPNSIADTILFEADRTCCICNDRSRKVIIHHIDGNPNNQDFDNLVALCFDHHHEASVTNNLGRSLSIGQIKKYRDQWYERVRSKRQLISNKLPSTEELHNAIIEALACYEVKKIDTLLTESDWESQVSLLKSLLQFTSISYGYKVRKEILNAIQSVTDRTRHNMPPKVAFEVTNLINATLPIFSLVAPARRKISDFEKNLLLTAQHQGYSMAYDSVKYLKNIAIVSAGSRVLFVVLRYSHLNNLKDIKKETQNSFNSLSNLALKTNFIDAKTWIDFEKADALALEKDSLPKFPSDIEIKIQKYRD